jgi:GH43 family beta-xylosidase
MEMEKQNCYLKIWSLYLFSFCVLGCNGSNEESRSLQVETLNATGVTATEAVCTGRITDKNERISSYGVDLISKDDTVQYRRTSALSGSEFRFKIENLRPEQTYQYRAYVNDGTDHYGDIVNFTTNKLEIIASYIPLADPFILFHDGVYYAYGTNSDDGIPVYTSYDLVSWKQHSTFALHKDNSYGDKWFWAPEVYYKPENKTFYLFYSAEEHICVATSQSPTGPFKQTVQQPMRTEKSIDNTLFIDDDGKAYLFFVRFTNGNVIWSAELESDWMTVKESTLKMCIEATAAWERVQAKVAEGPSVFKQNGIYYLLYSANDYQNQNYGVGYATSNSLTGTWMKATENPILQKPDTELVGTGHGALFSDENGKLRYVFHAHHNPATIHPRKMYIANLFIDAGGRMSMDKNNIIYPNEYR